MAVSHGGVSVVLAVTSAAPGDMKAEAKTPKGDHHQVGQLPAVRRAQGVVVEGNGSESNAPPDIDHACVAPIEAPDPENESSPEASEARCH